MSIPSDFSGSITSLEGSLLLADTTLRGGIFADSVIYLTHHGKDGAHGYVLNHPTGHPVGQFLGGSEFAPLADVPAFTGGPVATERLAFATVGWDNRANRFSFHSHLSTDEARDAHQAGMDVRAFVGYSGWSPGQLEQEIERRSWIVLRHPGPLLADPEALPNLWSRILGDMGPFFKIIALTPAEPSLN